LSYALRSTYEVMTALEIAQRLGYCSPEKTRELLDEADEIAAVLRWAAASPPPNEAPPFLSSSGRWLLKAVLGNSGFMDY